MKVVFDVELRKFGIQRIFGIKPAGDALTAYFRFKERYSTSLSTWSILLRYRKLALVSETTTEKNIFAMETENVFRYRNATVIIISFIQTVCLTLLIKINYSK